MLGYLAQCRYALLAALRELKIHPSHEISIERFDDISFDDAGTPVELIQAKHSTYPGDVSDKSVDIWKTILIWTKRVKADSTLTAQTRFVFLTTATAVEGSALALLRQDIETRDVGTALSLLISAAETSTNQTSQKGRDAFLDLEEALQILLVSNIWVFDQAPNIINAREEIEIELTLGVPPGHLESYTDRLEGWWFRRVIASLSNDDAPNITLSSLLGKITEIRDAFSADGLPLDRDIEDITVSAIEDDDDRYFVRQMRLVAVGATAASGAVQDYYRAFTQRSKWVREDLLLDEEAEGYDKVLIDAMQRECEAVLDEMPLTDEAVKKRYGRKIFHWSTRHHQPLRNRHEIWLSAGSLQMLADRKLIGWHPDYEMHLNDENPSS